MVIELIPAAFPLNYHNIFFYVNASVTISTYMRLGMLTAPLLEHFLLYIQLYVLHFHGKRDIRKHTLMPTFQTYILK